MNSRNDAEAVRRKKAREKLKRMQKPKEMEPLSYYGPEDSAGWLLKNWRKRGDRQVS